MPLPLPSVTVSGAAGGLFNSTQPVEGWLPSTLAGRNSNPDGALIVGQPAPTSFAANAWSVEPTMSRWDSTVVYSVTWPSAWVLWAPWTCEPSTARSNFTDTCD